MKKSLASTHSRDFPLYSWAPHLFVLLGALLITVTACLEPLAPRFAGDIINPKYERRSNYDNVIVFVHGIFGDAKSTWTNTATNAYWPDLMRRDATFADTDIYTFAYSSPFLNASYTLDDLVENMRMVFDRDEVFSRHKRVIFLCHSMGGLIVRAYLQRYRPKASQVPFIFFFSTPTDGSHITEIARFLSHNPQVKSMLPAKINDNLNFMQKNWRALEPPIRSYCAYEIQDTFGFRIVDEKSATMLCDGPVDPLPHNHMDVVKPEDTSDLIYTEFAKAFRSVPAYIQFRTEVEAVDKEIQVDCGKVLDANILVKPDRLSEAQTIVGVIPTLQNGTNLKSESTETVETTKDSAMVHVRIAGPDAKDTIACRGDSRATLRVSFILNNPISN